MAPAIRLPDFCRAGARSKLDDAGADIGAANVDGQNPIEPREYSIRDELGAAQESRCVRMMPDRAELDGLSRMFCQNGGAPDRELADPPFTETAANQDMLRLAPCRQFQKMLHNLGERM